MGVFQAWSRRRARRPAWARHRRRTTLERRLREARFQQARRLWKRIAWLAAIAIATTAAVLALWPSTPGLEFGLGVLDGAAVVVVLCAINVRTHNLTMGSWSERWTSESLRKQRGWLAVDNVPMFGFDIDHVVYAPGGVLAIESKYYGPTSEKTATSRQARDIEQTRRGATATRSLLRSFTSDAHDIVPVLICWGVGAPSAPPSQHDDVWVIHGNDLRNFLPRFDEGPYSAQIRRELARTTREYVQRRDRDSAAREGTPTQLKLPRSLKEPSERARRHTQR